MPSTCIQPYRERLTNGTVSPLDPFAGRDGQHLPDHGYQTPDPVSSSTQCARMRYVSDTTSSSLYRRSLKLALDWAVHRYVWRGQALYIRGLFEANKHVTEPRQQRVCAFPG